MCFRSFVENHIREVHKGHPVIVTELSVDQEMTDTPIGKPVFLTFSCIMVTYLQK